MNFEEQFQRVYGLPYVDNVHIITPESGIIYGFAWITSDPALSERGWQCSTGSFEYLYGKWLGLFGYFDMKAEFSPEEEDVPTFTGAFFILNANLQPIEVITSVSLSPEMQARTGNPGNTHTLISRDLSLVFDETVPVLDFEV